MLDETYWLHVGWDILYIHEAKILVKKNPVSKVSEVSEKNTKNQKLCTVPMLGEKVYMKVGSTAHQI